MNDLFEETKKKWTLANQGHVFKYWEGLDSNQKTMLLNQLNTIDVDAINQIYYDYNQQSGSNAGLNTSPFTAISEVTKRSISEITNYRNSGLTEISFGRVAVLLLAGGQGTRLGSTYPKGMYDVNLPSHKSLFQIQGERIARLQNLAFEQCGKSEIPVIPWYIMVSSATRANTVSFFERKNYFGLNKSNVMIFEQDSYPCLGEDGLILMESKHSLLSSPCGNGGLWHSIKSCGVFDDMRKREIEWVYIYNVDNLLVKVADPEFIGFCKDNQLMTACKIVEKKLPHEAIGVLSVCNGKYRVLEYSEISSQKANEINEDGRLTYNAAIINIFNFNISCIENLINSNFRLPKHIAKKKTYSLDPHGKLLKQNCLKIEMFIFDVFEHLNNLDAYQIHREEEFAPLKNGEDVHFDNPKTCRESLSRLHQKYIEMAGGEVSGDISKGCEISPLISYAGESLEPIVRGKKFVLPLHLEQ